MGVRGEEAGGEHGEGGEGESFGSTDAFGGGGVGVGPGGSGAGCRLSSESTWCEGDERVEVVEKRRMDTCDRVMVISKVTSK